jgi:hypothetical protein
MQPKEGAEEHCSQRRLQVEQGENVVIKTAGSCKGQLFGENCESDCVMKSVISV